MNMVADFDNWPPGGIIIHCVRYLFDYPQPAATDDILLLYRRLEELYNTSGDRFYKSGGGETIFGWLERTLYSYQVFAARKMSAQMPSGLSDEISELLRRPFFVHDREFVSSFESSAEWPTFLAPPIWYYAVMHP